MSAEVTQLRPEADRAKDYKDRVRAGLDQALAVMNEARRDDMRVDFSVGYDSFGRATVQSMSVTKVLA